MLIARRRPFAVRKKYGDGLPSRSLITGWGPVSTSWLHNAEFNSASKPEETIAPSEASPPFSNIQIIKSDRCPARLIIRLAHQCGSPNTTKTCPKVPYRRDVAPLLGRIDRRAGLVALRQTSVRRRHDRRFLHVAARRRPHSCRCAARRPNSPFHACDAVKITLRERAGRAAAWRSLFF